MGTGPGEPGRERADLRRQVSALTDELGTLRRRLAEQPHRSRAMEDRITALQRELAHLGIEYVTLDGPAVIGRACVLRKPSPLTFWREEEVTAYRALFRLDPPPPKPGSLLYLSRAGVRSEQARAARDYLGRLGFDTSRMQLVSYGEERPVAIGDGEDAYSQNRRDEFYLNE